MAAVRPRVDKTRIFAARLVTDGHVRLNTRRIEAGMEEIQRFKGKTTSEMKIRCQGGPVIHTQTPVRASAKELLSDVSGSGSGFLRPASATALF